tara:strand:+ start:605 stop:850 length:246 start_codon:yes stop_codon:yes gene_type:complete
MKVFKRTKGLIFFEAIATIVVLFGAGLMLWMCVEIVIFPVMSWPYFALAVLTILSAAGIYTFGYGKFWGKPIKKEEEYVES